MFKPIVRRMAAHVDPDTGERDLDLVGERFKAYGHTLGGVHAAVSKGGRLRCGDPIRVGR